MSELESFLTFVLSKEGCDYVWPNGGNNFSGKDLTFAIYKNVYDCSGLVTAGIYHATNAKVDWRSARNAQALYDLLEPTTKKPCLAFYGKSKSRIDHVVIVFEDGRILGANGGGRWCETPEIARLKDARVRFYPSHLYRKDFIGFRAIPL